MALNYYAINQVVGGRMRLGRRPRFGAFTLLGTVGEMVKGLPLAEAQVEFTPAMEETLVSAFEEVREGHPPDRILWDRSLARRFYKRCRELGLTVSSAALGRRLLNIRKNPSRYARKGLILTPSKESEPQPSIVWDYAYAVEYALVTLKYRYGASIDSVLVDPDLADEFDELAIGVAPKLTSRQVRLAALYIRKTRHLSKKDVTLFENLNVKKMDKQLAEVGTLAQLEIDALPTSEGLFQLVEANRRSLFIGRVPDLQAGIRRFAEPFTLQSLSNDFWTPDPTQITASVFEGSRYLNIGVAKWQIALIREHTPIFNWPVNEPAAA